MKFSSYKQPDFMGCILIKYSLVMEKIKLDSKLSLNKETIYHIL